MKKTYLLLLLFLLIISAQGCALNKPIPLYSENTDKATALSLQIPVELDVVYHNGSRKSVLTPYQPMIEYQILPGNHLLGLQYQDIKNDEEGNHESIKSKIVLFKFTAKTGEKYSVDFQPPESLKQARTIAKNLKLTLLENTNVIATSFVAVENVHQSDFFTQGFDADTASLFDDEQSEALAPAPHAAAIEHLKYWWKNSSEQEKSAFKTWQATVKQPQ